MLLKAIKLWLNPENPRLKDKGYGSTTLTDQRKPVAERRLVSDPDLIGGVESKPKDKG
jgi:hypothetical protein